MQDQPSKTHLNVSQSTDAHIVSDPLLSQALDQDQSPRHLVHTITAALIVSFTLEDYLEEVIKKGIANIEPYIAAMNNGIRRRVGAPRTLILETATDINPAPGMMLRRITEELVRVKDKKVYDFLQEHVTYAWDLASLQQPKEAETLPTLSRLLNELSPFKEHRGFVAQFITRILQDINGVGLLEGYLAGPYIAAFRSDSSCNVTESILLPSLTERVFEDKNDSPSPLLEQFIAPNSRHYRK